MEASSGDSGTQFSSWLWERLKELRTDEAIFGPYIVSILEEEDDKERIEALDGILGDLGGGIDPTSLREEILDKWNGCQTSSDRILSSSVDQTKDNPTNNGLGDSHNLEEIIRSATISAELSSSKKNVQTDPKLRAAILSTVGGSSDSEEDGKGQSSSMCKKKGHGVDDALSSQFGRNDNTEKVLMEQKEIKDKIKAESAKKRERDKEDRLKQKAAAQERKDKAKKKATKVERKR